MGYGDELLATGMARGAMARGKRVAFGDGRRIIWGPHAEMIFRGNPNIAPKGLQSRRDLEWCDHYHGHRHYNKAGNGRWIWNFEFCATPGEMFFDANEIEFAKALGSGFVVIEPNVPSNKPWTVNKQWDQKRYEAVAYTLAAIGIAVVQFSFGKEGYKLGGGVEHIETTSFRHALAALSRAALYIGPEGGLHHGAAAVGTKAIVLFGGFIPPQVVGYEGHVNFAATEFCGSMTACEHCREAMDAIGAEQVFQSAMEMLGR